MVVGINFGTKRLVKKIFYIFFRLHPLQLSLRTDGNELTNTHLFHQNPTSSAMASKLGSIHTLNGCNSVGKIPFVGDNQRIFKNICSTFEVVDKEVGGIVFGGLIVTQTVLPFVLTDDIGRLKG